MNLRITLLAFLCLCATAILRAERVDMLKAVSLTLPAIA